MGTVARLAVSLVTAVVGALVFLVAVIALFYLIGLASRHGIL